MLDAFALLGGLTIIEAIKGADEIQDDGNSDGGDDSDDDVNI